MLASFRLLSFVAGEALKCLDKSCPTYIVSRAGSSRTEQPQAEPGQCAPGRHSIISEPPWRASSSEQQVRAGRLDFGAERMAHVNRQSVCSVEPALWADSWQRVSAGVVRRAACRSEIPSMFAVRMRLSHSRRELSSTCIEPSDERMGSVAGRSARSLRSPRAAIGESNREPRRRSDDAVSGALTQGCRSPSRKSMLGVGPFAPPSTPLES